MQRLMKNWAVINYTSQTRAVIDIYALKKVILKNATNKTVLKIIYHVSKEMWILAPFAEAILFVSSCRSV